MNKENNKFRTNKTRAEWVNFLSEFNYRYFMTVTLNHNSKDSDKDVQRFIRIIHQNLFGRNFIKQEKLLGLAIVKERQKLNNFKAHYHILVEEGDGISLFDMAIAMIHASKKCRSIQNLNEGDYFKQLTTNYFKTQSPKANGVHLNVVEIETAEDLKRIVNYLCKTNEHKNYSNIYIARANDNRDYFPIVTEN